MTPEERAAWSKRMREARTYPPRPKCACGCGETVAVTKGGNSLKFARGHAPKSKGSSRQQMDKIRNMRSDQSFEKIAASRRGKAFGRIQTGHPLHPSQKLWTLRDPLGGIWSFKNLSKWTRENIGMFLPDERPESRRPFQHRVNFGIKSLKRTKKAATHYRGWTLISAVKIPQTS